MENELKGLDGESLRTLYDKETRELHVKLLSGATWEELGEQRKKVTKLAIILHKRSRNESTSGHPAAFTSRLTDAE